MPMNRELTTGLEVISNGPISQLYGHAFHGVINSHLIKSESICLPVVSANYLVLVLKDLNIAVSAPTVSCSFHPDSLM